MPSEGFIDVRLVGDLERPRQRFSGGRFNNTAVQVNGEPPECASGSLTLDEDGKFTWARCGVSGCRLGARDHRARLRGLGQGRLSEDGREPTFRFYRGRHHLAGHLPPRGRRAPLATRSAERFGGAPGRFARRAASDDHLTGFKRVRTGDQRAFKLLVERYQRKVYAVALGMLKDKEEARDVAQEAFVKVYKYLDHFKGDASFYTWLYRITVNICIDVIRRKGSARATSTWSSTRRWPTTPAEANIGALGSRLGTNPQKSALRKELADKIAAAFQQLPETHRQILLLREIEGMSYEDLARTLEIPKGTVMSRLFHARLKMQKILSEYLELDESKAGVGSE